MSSELLHSLSQSCTSELKLVAASEPKNESNKSYQPKNDINSPLAIIDNTSISPTPSVITPDIDYAFIHEKVETLTATDDDDELTDEGDDIPFMNFLSKYSEISEDIIFAEHGYKKLNKICDTLQGALYKGEQTSNNQYVAIKKTDKVQFQERVTIQSGFSFYTTENRIKEALILKHLTVDNRPMGDYIVRYVDFFETDNDYYLVMEYIESETNLKQFVQTAFKYIQQRKLKLNEYQKTIKYLYWQLTMTINWLHNDMKCTHLDVCMENVLLADCEFIEGKDGNMTINPAICIKLGDFGVSELFKTDKSSRSLKTLQPFICQKQHLSLDNEAYLAPSVCHDELYDARSADIWSLGIILYECMAGKPLYEQIEVWQSSSSSVNGGYWALTHNKLKEYLSKVNKLIYFNCNSFELLVNLLNIHENKRYNGRNILSHKWFNLYYKKYRKQLQRKSVIQSRKFIENKVKIKYFPFYKHSIIK